VQEGTTTFLENLQTKNRIRAEQIRKENEVIWLEIETLNDQHNFLISSSPISVDEISVGFGLRK
jgi:hypothetical protein